MTMLEGAQIERETPSRGTFDSLDSSRKRRPGVAELSGHMLGEIGGSRTEHQVRPHEGFATGEVSLRNPIRLTSDGPATRIQARPPGWTETEGLPCVPPRDQSPAMRAAWFDLWDVGSTKTATEQAEKLCAECPVRQRCLDAAMIEELGQHHAFRFLVRGGLTPEARWAQDPTVLSG